MADANCRYCVWLGHGEPKTLSTSWEPLDWLCDHWRRHEVREGWHECDDYEREVGSDDDLGDQTHGERFSGDFDQGDVW